MVPSREDGGTAANPRRRTLVFTNQNYSLVAVYFWERLSNSLRECDSQAKPQLLQHYFYRSNSLCHSGLIQLHNSFVKCLSRSLPFGSGTNSPKQTNFQSRCFHMCSQHPVSRQQTNLISAVATTRADCVSRRQFDHYFGSSYERRRLDLRSWLQAPSLIYHGNLPVSHQ